MFAAFPDKLRTQLLASSVKREFIDGQIVQQRGDPSNGFYIVEEGKLKLGRFGSDGTFHANLIIGAGDSYGELAVIGNYPRILDVVAVGLTTLRWIRASEFERALSARKETMQQMMQIMAQQLQEALNTNIAQRKFNAIQILARHIAAMCGSRKPPVELDIRQSDLTELIGTSRVTISKALERLENHGLVKRRYGRIIVYDIDLLRHY